MSYPGGTPGRRERRLEARRKRARERLRITLGVAVAVAVLACLAVGAWLILERKEKPPEPETFKVTVPEGLTNRQTAQKVEEATEGDVSSDGFYKATLRGDYDYDFLEEAGGNLEGFLFPKTYEMTEDTTSTQAVEMMLNQFEKETGDLDWSRAEALGLSPYQVLTVASMIEKEAKLPEERPVIASVIYNRLRVPMKLQIDATVQYALGEWKSVLTYEDLKVDSPYNTYRVDGLPPGPICNPGFESIRAALYPDETDYLYYILTSSEGGHSFTSDYEVFKKWKEERDNR